MVEIRKVKTKQEMDLVYGIRREVFIDEQGVPEELEMDGLDEQAVHVLSLVNGVPAGCGRLLRYGTDAKIGRVAVKKDMRRGGIGEGICKLLISIAKDSGAERIVINAQLTAEAFYSRLGFVREGGVFMEAGIEHVRMTKML